MGAAVGAVGDPETARRMYAGQQGDRPEAQET
jgi:hypothetical protein